jgi:hypothetical protein
MKLTKTIAIIFAALILFTGLPGCKKEEGVGGTSTIHGKVIVHDFDAGFQEPAPREVYPAADKKAFIIYGEDGTTYDDDYDTSYDGTYEFKYLQKGKYKIFVYSKDSTGAKTTGILSGRKIPVIIDVEIKSNGSTVEAPDIIILDNNF